MHDADTAHRLIRLLAAGLVWVTLAACGGADGADSDEEIEARRAAMLAHMQAHFDTQLSLPPQVVEALERGEISQTEIDRRAAEGELRKFFEFRTPADVPGHLVWENGSDLPDIGSPEAKKGGTLNLFVQDFPRTLRPARPRRQRQLPPLASSTTWSCASGSATRTTPTSGRRASTTIPGIAIAWATGMLPTSRYSCASTRRRAGRTASRSPPTTCSSSSTSTRAAHQGPLVQQLLHAAIEHVTRYDEHTFSDHPARSQAGRAFAGARARADAGMHFFKELGEDFVERYQWRFRADLGRLRRRRRTCARAAPSP
jgi:microcin C transport system substrate-binding protein